VANTNLDVIATTHARFVKGPVTDGVLTASPFYYLLKQRGKVKTGVPGTKYGPGVLRYDTHTISKWSGAEVSQVPIPRMFTNWEHEWCGYYSQIASIEWDLMENKGEEAIAEMDAEQKQAMKDDWEVFVNGLLFADGSSETPIGLSGLPAFVKATGTYGGIAQTNDYWKANILTGSGISNKTFETHPVAYTRRLLNTVGNKGKSSGGKPNNRPDFAITTLAMYEHFLNYFEAKGQTVITSNQETVGLGWRNVMIDGLEIYWDNSCTAQTMYMLTMKDMEWIFQTKAMFATATHKVPQPIGSEINQTWTKCALVCRQPRRTGAITSSGIS
jgi:hypothetical protein